MPLRAALRQNGAEMSSDLCWYFVLEKSWRQLAGMVRRNRAGIGGEILTEVLRLKSSANQRLCAHFAGIERRRHHGRGP